MIKWLLLVFVQRPGVERLVVQIAVLVNLGRCICVLLLLMALVVGLVVLYLLVIHVDSDY